MPLGTFFGKLLWGISKSGFIYLYILLEKLFEAARPVLSVFLDVYDLHGVLDTSRCWMSHRRWRDRRYFWLDCHEINWWPMVRSSMKRQ